MNGNVLIVGSHFNVSRLETVNISFCLILSSQQRIVSPLKTACTGRRKEKLPGDGSRVGGVGGGPEVEMQLSLQPELSMWTLAAVTTHSHSSLG